MAWIVQCMILGGYVWFEKLRIPNQSYNCWLIRGMRSVLFIVFTVISFVFIDTNIKILIFGIVGYSNIFLHLASILLTFILAAELLIGALIVNPNRKKIVIFGTMLAYFVYLWYFYLNSVNLSELSLFNTKYSAAVISVLYPILVGVIAASVLTGAELLYNKARSEKRIADKPFWNIQVKVKSFFNVRFNIILWALLSAEMILNFQGLSLLLWLIVFF